VPEITKMDKQKNESESNGGKKPIKARAWVYDYVKQEKKKRNNESMMQTLSQICREHRESNRTPLEELMSDVKDLAKGTKGNKRRTLIITRHILRMLGEGNDDVVDVVQDTLEQLERSEKMMEAENSD
jgi:hypothetical protein